MLVFLITGFAQPLFWNPYSFGGRPLALQSVQAGEVRPQALRSRPPDPCVLHHQRLQTLAHKASGSPKMQDASVRFLFRIMEALWNFYNLCKQGPQLELAAHAICRYPVTQGSKALERVHRAARLEVLEVLQPIAGELGLRQVEASQRGQVGQREHGGVGDALVLRQRQRCQPWQRAQMDHACGPNRSLFPRTLLTKPQGWTKQITSHSQRQLEPGPRPRQHPQSGQSEHRGDTAILGAGTHAFDSHKCT